MGSSFFLSFFLFIFLFKLSCRVTGQNSCQTNTCSDSGPAIRFPFWIERVQQKTCGYPKFDLKCSKQKNDTILELPYSGRFWLQQIDYTQQQIVVVDPDDCLWGKLKSLNLSGSPFRGIHYENYRMLKCSTKLNKVLPRSSKRINCMSNSSYEIWVTASETDAVMLLSINCESIATMSVPVPWSGYYENDDQSSHNGERQDLVLTWDEPSCADCEANGGRCGWLQSNSDPEVGCLDGSRTRQGIPRSVSYAVTLGAGIPALLCCMGLVCYVGSKVRRYRRRNTHVAEAGFSSSTINNEPNVVMVGLDNITIGSYPMVVLGESCRLPKPNDNTCSICLAEYQPKETLRTIPHCQHCFHADCIDEWLRTNATCPLCRTSPEPLPLAHSPP